MVGGVILAAWTPFWAFVSGLSTIDFMRTSTGRPSIGTFYLSPTLSAGLNVVGFGVIVYAFILLSRQVSWGASVNHSESTSQQPRLDVPGFGVNTTLPDGRAIISCSLEDLGDAYHKNTIDQFNRLLSGKWIKTSGRIGENHGNGQVWLSNADPIFVLQFAEGWSDQLSPLGRGATITVRGKILKADYSGVRLEECELL